MNKGIKLPGNPLQIKCKLVLDSCFGGCSEKELAIMLCMLEFSTGNAITLTPDLSRQVMLTAGIEDNSFSTYISRLSKRNVFSKQGRTIIFHPVFNGLQEAEKLVFSFAGENKEKDLSELQSPAAEKSLTD